MSASNFSIVNGADGVTKVPISTATDANGYTAVGHLAMIPVAGIATPVDGTHPLPIAAASLPLPAGAATDASLSGVATVLGKISATVSAPPLPAGAATDASLAGVTTVLGKISTTVAAPPLPAGAATDTSLAGVTTVLGKISATVSAPPLPAGAATDASLAGVLVALNRIAASLAALQTSEAPYQGVVAMTVDQAQPAQRAIRIICTTAGNVSLTYLDGSKDVIPVAVGLSYVAGAFTAVNGAGTSATATYANMK